MIKARTWPAVSLYGKYIFTFGGMMYGKGDAEFCEKYDSLENLWTELPKLPCELTHGTTAVYQDHIYITG